MDTNIFDLNEAMERIGDEELIYELLEDIVELADTTVTEITEGIQNENHEMIRISGHTLKGTAANLALHNLSEAGKALEFAGKEQNVSQYNILLDNLKKAVEDFKSFMANK